MINNSNLRLQFKRQTVKPFPYSLLIIMLSLLLVLIFHSCAYASINLATIAKIESSGNPLAIGDNGKALGLYQLHASVVKDYNKANNTNLSHKQMLNASTAYKVANWYLNIKIPSYLRHYGIAVNRDNVLSCYNAGIGSVLKGRKAVKYIAKYNKLNKGVK